MSTLVYDSDLLLPEDIAWCGTVPHFSDGADPSNQASGVFSCHGSASKLLGLELRAANSAGTTREVPADLFVMIVGTANASESEVHARIGFMQDLR